MGDRGNIAIIQSDQDQVWLYSHWGGHGLPKLLKAGLTKGKERWDDPSYLAKIIIGAAVPAGNWDKETGYGISCRMQDNEHPINVVDIPKQRVYTLPESQLVDGKVPKNYQPEESQTFEQFIESDQSSKTA